MNTSIQCKICNHIGKDIRQHVKTTHNITIEDYKTQYGDVICELTLFKRAESNKISHSKFEVKNKKSEAMKYIRSEQHWATYGMKGKIAWNKGLTTNDERVKQNTIARNKTMQQKYWSKKTYEKMFGVQKAAIIKQKQSQTDH